MPDRFIDFSKEYKDTLKGTVTIDISKVINEDIIGGGMNVAFSDYTYVQYPDNEKSYDGINCAGEIKLSGSDRITIRPKSITVLTTYTHGSSKPRLAPLP